MDKIIFEDNYASDEAINETCTPLDRASRGRFAKGNQEGRKCQNGYPGKPRGARNRKTLIAREFAEDVLYLNPQTGKQTPTMNSAYGQKGRQTPVPGYSTYS